GDSDGGALEDAAPSDASDASNAEPDSGASDASHRGPHDAGGGTEKLVAPSVPLSVSYTHACAIRGAAGHVYCWGDNGSGQLGTSESPPDWLTPVQIKRPEGEPLSGAVQVAVGDSFSCALLDDGRAYCWGDR